MTATLERVVGRDEALRTALANLGGRGSVEKGTPVRGSDIVTAERVIPAQQATYGEFPDAVNGHLRAVLEARGIARPYVHQAEAIVHTLAGRNVVVVTPTASGKTLCYNVPVLSAMLDQPSTRALYLFPTKALAQDQLAELRELTDGLRTHGHDIGAFTYDGDTPQDARRVVRGRAHLVLSNPEMLHSGILPHHPRWAKLFENLRYIVIDELHAYRGVFGSHLANILRRLERICRHYGSEPRFICSSATIANPRELAERLTAAPFSLVNRSGAPHGEKQFVMVNPPVLSPQLGLRRSYLSEARRLALEFLRRQLQIIVFTQSRLATEILTTYLKDGCRGLPGGAAGIRGYRGGYLPLRRREIERGLRDGVVRGVVSTNALELGIDIGSLDVCVMAGYPGTIAATWQRAGRAGRRSARSAAVLIASSAPVDQFVVQHPDFFFDGSPEHGLINPDNLHILLDHIKCAAFELPFTADERFGHDDLPAVLRLLAEEGFVHQSGNQWHWIHESYPANAISLRSISSDNFVVVDLSDHTRVIGEVDFTSAMSTLHKKAIYIVEGQQHQVDRLDVEGRKAYVRKVDCDYYTDAITYTKVTILDEFDADGGGAAAADPAEAALTSDAAVVVRSHGEVHVVTRVVGFKKIKFYTGENVGAGDLDLPEQQMHTSAYWLTVPRQLYAQLPHSPAERRDGVAGVGIALRSMAQLLLMCERHDIGLAIHGDEGRGPVVADEPQIFIYDNYPGGIGFSEPLFDMHVELLDRVHRLIADCPCQVGCPACVGPVGLTGPHVKAVALEILEKLRRLS
ncbi:MAG: DEAD/DEAH box helicase [Vicinamibacterales bacterium]